MTQGQTLAITAQASWPLHSVSQTQVIETRAQAQLPEHQLMQRAGFAIARLAMALAPHAHTVWIACGPGNNGGDGLEAAVWLKQWGKHPVVTWLRHPTHTPADTAHAAQLAQKADVTWADEPPTNYEFVIDALLGIGAQRAPEGPLAQWIEQIQHSPCPVLCVDVPSGLMPDTGEWLLPWAPVPTTQRHTLSLLTLKPGLFTAHGRDAAGQVWFNDLGVDSTHTPSCATLQISAATHPTAAHSSHKGSRGDVAVLGGASGMQGAAILAATAALQGGAGRVFVSRLSHDTQVNHPALMTREPAKLPLENTTVVCGCGGGPDIAAWLARVLSIAPRLVLDADALNTIACDTQLLTLLQRRHHNGLVTVITPHPLEASRLLGQTASAIQANRLQAAQALVAQTHAIVVLKGSGSVIAAPNQTAVINHSGNAQLACAGTGDVLAGLIGARLGHTTDAFAAVCEAVHTHGHAADTWPTNGPALNAATLAASLR